MVRSNYVSNQTFPSGCQTLMISRASCQFTKDLSHDTGLNSTPTGPLMAILGNYSNGWFTQKSESENGDWIGGYIGLLDICFSFTAKPMGNCYRLYLARKLRYPTDILEMDSWSVIHIILTEIFSEMRIY